MFISLKAHCTVESGDQSDIQQAAIVENILNEVDD